MKPSVLWLLMAGLAVLCVAYPAFAFQGFVDPTPQSSPEITAGAAAGALTIVTGALALLSEKLRRK